MEDVNSNNNINDRFFVYARVNLMIQNAHVARHDFVLQNCTAWNIDSVTVICNDDNSSLFAHDSTQKRKTNEDKIRLDFLLIFFLSVLLICMIITRNETPRPNVTSPDTVK